MAFGRSKPRQRVDPSFDAAAAAAPATQRAAPKRKSASVTMKAALLASLAAHAGVFGYAFFVWTSPETLEAPPIENVSVDIIEIADETEVTLGDETGSQDEPEAVRTVEAEREAETVQEGEVRDAPVREVARETQAPPPPTVREIPIREIATEPEIAPEPEVAETPEPVPEVAEAPAEPEPETEVAAAPLPPTPLGRPAGLRAPPQQVAVAEPEPAPQPTEVAAVAQPVTPAPAMPQVQPQPTETLDPSLSQDTLLDTLDPDRIAALLNKQEPVAASAPTQTAASQTPSLGAVDGAGQTLTVSEIGALRRRLAQCWTPPLGARGAETLTVKVNMQLNPDGTVRGAPRIVDAPFGPAADAAAQAATRAVLQCQPYALPPEKYDLWQDITINFDPRQMLGL
ncbi:MAG: hypothetical protein AAF321_06825 [Pseudomonadota bacterium]